MARKDEEKTGMPEALRRIEEAGRRHATLLDLSFLGLATIPNSIGQLANLRYLSLDDNQITAIPDSIAELESLMDLSLDDNQITAIPDSIAQLPSLIQLSLNY